MISLAGAFNACATLFTLDFYGRLHRGISEEKLVWVGRIATASCGHRHLLDPVIRGGRGLYDYLRECRRTGAPDLRRLFPWGVLIKRLNAKGCLWALISKDLSMGIFVLP